ncbi:radical SAM protein [Desulfonatronospira sp. MSAO_Bac3]|uniref:radical SAM protein n=1 Tax=Desulfonatronospira sp. MSAO_Bac3 TaxID=2293857 RepID=UPI000FF061BF|nr:radical SAM protein [Desulfonatronospira sp. MSAO_Bac3]RQD78634.1 MAG: radical SAM protein [Desulfonatronospira sp. MSAO_Bac3]
MITRRNFVKGVFATAGTFFFAGCSEAGNPGVGNSEWTPAYARLEEEGRLKDRVDEAYGRLEKCTLCPHKCGVNRLDGEEGFCRAPGRAVVHSRSPHFGEELPLVGDNGSGTIFFSNCNLRCVFCQNWPIAHEGRGREVEDEELAEMMLDLQRRGCHNINLVTPTHVMPNILSATRIAMKNGLNLPLCYNTGGYELVENIELLDGIVDIYLPDLKFMGSDESAKYVLEGRGDYPEMAQDSIIEMNRQVGVLEKDERGVARRGVMVRHLVMPNRVAGTREFVDWVAENLPGDTYVNIMSQYRVEHMAFEYDKIARSTNSREFVEAIDWAKEAGLTNLDERSMSQYRLHRRRMS